MPRNRFTLFALIWLAALLYSLLQESNGRSLPPFPHFDKVMHAALFFAQFWLAARAFLHENRRPPYLLLLAAALILAAASEAAQFWFTQTRRAEWGDAAADVLGAAAALWLASRAAAARKADT
ncbi:VanZ family protein [Neisseria leonii]|uniref:VanZ family protein n=1 Tax=Neisseria leonii TaxID=2995413 RepID=UPI00237B8E70|nr:VanZ family protein [Neisseria sp. 3986]MDD9326357.1 VanZ family protein [Neisseria sp. 3986]